MHRSVADFGFLLIWRPGFGHLGSAAEFAMADDANRSMAAPAIDGNRSLSLVRPVPGVAPGGPRRPPGQARRPSRTRWIERSDPRLAGPMLRC
jgi:hypothetical protein